MPRGGGSTSNRGARSGIDCYSGRGGSSQFSSSGTSNNQYINSCTEETPAEDEHVFEEHTENVVSSRNTHEDTSGSASLHDNDLYHEIQAFEHNEVEEGDALASLVSTNMQQLNIQEERQFDEPEEDIPSVVIPNHLQVQTADCSHLSFRSFSSRTLRWLRRYKRNWRMLEFRFRVLSVCAHREACIVAGNKRWS
ncbi:uncharacterized protein LOC110929078 [Helianthus annuus]|uniref:uncharacterized protein LOC110929078 n=1 Tax=Helianthus annuus TaxID=4232 RepID=UPI0016530593|nr:uncharacterized protein LOC110929078 [Helianthus annuus]